MSQHLVGLILIQTDDLLCAGTGRRCDRCIDQLKEAFNFGKWFDMMKDGPVELNGRKLRQASDGSLTVDVTEYVCKKLKPLAVEKQGRSGSDPATEMAITSYRGLIGGLLWAGRSRCPQVLGDVSILASRVKDLKVSDMQELNRALGRAQQTVREIVLPVISLSKLRWSAWVDASLANHRW